MVDEVKTPDVKSEKVDKKEASTKEQVDKSQVNAQAPLNLPEKLQGKSPEDIAKMYIELEKKYGEHTEEVNEARQYKKEREVLDDVISKNPQLYSLLEKEINKMYGKGDEEDVKVDPRVSDLRKSEESRTITEFQRSFGIDKLEPEKKTEMMKRVSVELAEMLDPGGSKTVGQILSEVSLSKLPKMLENAYWLANKDKLMDRGSYQDLSSIGSISASSSEKSDEGLTEHERNIAQKLGVSEDKYLQHKKEINKR